MPIEVKDLVQGNVKHAMGDAGAKSHDLWMVPRASIKLIPGFNDVRAVDPGYPEHLAKITSLIEANGYNKGDPLEVFIAREDGQDIIYLIDGYTRVKAVDTLNENGAGIEILPCVQRPNGTTMEDVLAAPVTSNSGRGLTPMGEAIICKRMIGQNLDEPEIATKLGFPVQKVRDLLVLIAAPKQIRLMVQTGRVSATNAIEVVKKHGNKATEVLGASLETAQAAGKKKVTKRQLAPKRDLLTEGIAWIKDQGGWTVMPDRKLVDLLAFVTGATAGDIEAKLGES